MAITTRATCEQQQNSKGLMSNWVPGKQTTQTTTLYCIYFLWNHCIAETQISQLVIFMFITLNTYIHIYIIIYIYIPIIFWNILRLFLNIWNLHMFFSSLLPFLWRLPTSPKPLESSKRQTGFPSCAMCISHRCQSRIYTSVISADDGIAGDIQSSPENHWDYFNRFHMDPYGCFLKMVGFPPKSPILIGFSIMNHPFWGTPIFGNIHNISSNHWFSGDMEIKFQGF